MNIQITFLWPADDIPFCSIFTYFQYSLIHDLVLNHAPFVAALFASRRGKINSLWIPSESQVFLRRCRCGLKKNKIQNSILGKFNNHFFLLAFLSFLHSLCRKTSKLSVKIGKKTSTILMKSIAEKSCGFLHHS